MKYRITWLQTSLLFLSTVVAVFFIGISSANSETATPFENTEFVEGPDVTAAELEALVDELTIEFDQFMVDTFKQMSEMYAANDTQKSKMRPEKHIFELRGLNTGMDFCKSDFDANDQLTSVYCDMMNMQAPVQFWYSHPSYKNILVDVGRHKNQGDLKDAENSIGTDVIISEAENTTTYSGKRLMVKSSSNQKLLIPVRGALLIRFLEPQISCQVESFKPFSTEGGSKESPACAFVLREGIALLKKLNTRP